MMITRVDQRGRVVGPLGVTRDAGDEQEDEDHEQERDQQLADVAAAIDEVAGEAAYGSALARREVLLVTGLDRLTLLGAELFARRTLALGLILARDGRLQARLAGGFGLFAARCCAPFADLSLVYHPRHATP